MGIHVYILFSASHKKSARGESMVLEFSFFHHVVIFGVTHC